MKKILIPLLVASSVFSWGLTHAAGIAIIAQPDFPAESISKKQAKKIWLGKRVKIGGIQPVPIDAAKGESSRKVFYKKIAKKKPGQLKTYWAKRMFKGKSFPPKSLDDDDSIKSWVMEDPTRVGYIDEKSIDDSIKVLLTVSND